MIDNGSDGMTNSAFIMILAILPLAIQKDELMVKNIIKMARANPGFRFS